MKIELTETEIAQAIVDWLAQGSILKSGGPYDVKFETTEGRVFAVIQLMAPKPVIEINEERG